MVKRFTDPFKWRNAWFRTLPLKAKLAWIYICDECDHVGIWKADYGLATFQLGFALSQEQLNEWFGSKIHLFEKSKVLIVPFFEFQYGESKNTWTAKVSARERLEALGFRVINNKVLIEKETDNTTTPGGQSLDSTPSVLIEDVVEVESIIEVKKKAEKQKGSAIPTQLFQLAQIWNDHCGDLPKVRECKGSRLAKAQKAWTCDHDLHFWVTVIERIKASTFCTGGGSTGWQADFDWLIQPETATKILEGKYDNRSGVKPTAQKAEVNFDELRQHR